jgi:hypothetical protein
MPPPVGNTWEMFLQEQLAHGPAELDLKMVRPGDRLVIGTKNTRYEFEWHDDGTVQLTTDRADRPWGIVTIAGCAFRESGVVARGVVFRGGKLEYLSSEGKVSHRTTVINSLTLIRPDGRGNSIAPFQSNATP